MTPDMWHRLGYVGLFIFVCVTHFLAYKMGYADCYVSQCQPLVDAIRAWKLRRRAEGFDEPAPQKSTEPYSPDSLRKPDSHQA